MGSYAMWGLIILGIILSVVVVNYMMSSNVLAPTGSTRIGGSGPPLGAGSGPGSVGRILSKREINTQCKGECGGRRKILNRDSKACHDGCRSRLGSGIQWSSADDV